MVRMQIYLTKKERDGLAALAEATGRKQSDLIREAVDRFIEQAGARRRSVVPARAAGLWKDRDDLPDFGGRRK